MIHIEYCRDMHDCFAFGDHSVEENLRHQSQISVIWWNANNHQPWLTNKMSHSKLAEEYEKYYEMHAVNCSYGEFSGIENTYW